MKFSNKDFAKIHAALGKTQVGAICVRDYQPILNKSGDPTDDNAFVVSIEQRDEGPGKNAHTRIDIRGSDGLIHQSYEQDHIITEPADDTAVGKELLLDLTHNVASGTPGVSTQEVLLPKGTVLTAAHVKMLSERRIAKIPTLQLGTVDVVARLQPLLEVDQPVDGVHFTPAELVAQAEFRQALRDEKK